MRFDSSPTLLEPEPERNSIPRARTRLPGSVWQQKEQQTNKCVSEKDRGNKDNNQQTHERAEHVYV
jgi:hypothetical protein